MNSKPISYEQSEAIWQAQQRAAEAGVRPEQFEWMRTRLKYGLPLTTDEVRLLWRLAFGFQIQVPPPRCQTCDGNCQVTVPGTNRLVTCPDCLGSGHTTVSVSPV